MYKRILIPFDGSDVSRQALLAGLDLARRSGGQVRVVHLLDDLAYLTGFEPSGSALQLARDYAGKTLAQAAALAQRAGVRAETVLLDQPGQRLAEAVAEQARGFAADLVVVGTHGRRGIGRVLLGSDAEQVIRHAPVPVLAVRDQPVAAALA